MLELAARVSEQQGSTKGLQLRCKWLLNPSLPYSQLTQVVSLPHLDPSLCCPGPQFSCLSEDKLSFRANSYSIPEKRIRNLSWFMDFFRALIADFSFFSTFCRTQFRLQLAGDKRKRLCCYVVLGWGKSFLKAILCPFYISATVHAIHLLQCLLSGSLSVGSLAILCISALILKEDSCFTRLMSLLPVHAFLCNYPPYKEETHI